MQRPADNALPIGGAALTTIRSGLDSVESVATSLSSLQLLPLAPLSATGNPIDWLSYAVLAWVAGVYMFTLRSLGAWMLLMRLRRQHAEPIDGSLLEACLALQEKLGVTRVVRYACSKAVDSPAVLGWLRPVVVLPLSVLAGLTPWQIEAIIAHELAHIRRWDAFVNLFQVATETLLFYHPAVWWVNRVIRNEREHCCDDVAVAACGNAYGYAKTLALLEESRSASPLALAANGGVLTTRIGRLLGVRKATRTMSAPGVALLAVLSIAGALMAGSASTQTIGDMPEPPTPPRPVEAPRVVLADAVPMAVKGDGGSYIAGLQAAGLKNLTVEEIIALKIQGVTPEYIRGLSAAGLSNLRVQDYLAARVQGITPEFVQKIRSHGFKDLTLHQLISLKMADIS